jgi:hypothetical protein
MANFGDIIVGGETPQEHGTPTEEYTQVVQEEPAVEDVTENVQEDTDAEPTEHETVEDTVTKKKKIDGDRFYHHSRELKDLNDEEKIRAILLPSVTSRQYRNIVNKLEIGETQDNLKMSEESGIAIGITDRGDAQTMPGNLFSGKLNDATNAYDVDGKRIGIREINIKSGKDKVTGKKAILKMASRLGLSSIIQIPLFHSGFWIALDTISESDIVYLETELAKKEIKYGRRTNGLIYSNEDVMYRQVIMDFVVTHLESTSLDLEGDDLFDYIRIQDFDTILLGIAQAMYPKGYNMVRACNNVKDIGDDGNVACTYKLEARVDPDKLLWIDRSAITDEHRKILFRTKPNSVSKEEVIEYQESLRANKPHKFTYGGIEFTLRPSSIRRHIDFGELWISSIESDLDELVATDNELNRQEIYQRLAMSDNLNKLGHLFGEISSEDSIIGDDEIEEFLKMLVNNKEAEKIVTKELFRFINSIYIAIAGIPVYICPSCRKAVEDGGEDYGKQFKEIIPINVFLNFFEVLALRTSGTKSMEELMF